MRKRKQAVDLDVMRELLEQPDVAPFVEQLAPDELEWYKALLVSEGIYDRYVRERNR